MVISVRITKFFRTTLNSNKIVSITTSISVLIAENIFSTRSKITKLVFVSTKSLIAIRFGVYIVKVRNMLVMVSCPSSRSFSSLC